MDKLAVTAIIQLITSLAGYALLIIGLFFAVKNINYINQSNPDDEEATVNAAYKKSMIFIACGLGLYFLARICLNLEPMQSEGYDIFTVAIQSLWESIKNFGFLLLFPIIIKRWRKNARRYNSK